MQARMAELKLQGPDGLQHLFTSALCEHLVRAGRRPVGWDEIIDGGELPKGATVMSWRGMRGGIVAAEAGFDVVMCPQDPCYFDHYQSDGSTEPLAIGGLNTLEDVYAFEPVPTALEGRKAAHVLGTQLQLWSEYLPEARDVEYMAFPRAVALAEVAWQAAPRDLSDFKRRLSAHLERLDVLGVNYRPLDGPRPWQQGGSGPRRRFDR